MGFLVPNGAATKLSNPKKGPFRNRRAPQPNRTALPPRPKQQAITLVTPNKDGLLPYPWARQEVGTTDSNVNGLVAFEVRVFEWLDVLFLLVTISLMPICTNPSSSKTTKF